MSMKAMKDTQQKLRFEGEKKNKERKGVGINTSGRFIKNLHYSPPACATSITFPGYLPIHECKFFLTQLDEKLREALIQNLITTCSHYESFMKGWKS